MRTIWVAIRGVNYTDRATREVGGNVDKLVRKQQELQTQMIQTFAAGMLWSVMAAMMVGGMIKIMETSYQGRNAIRVFTRSLNKFTKALSEQFMKVLGPVISGLTSLMDAMAKNEPLMRLIVGLMIIVTVLMAVQGVTMLLTAAMHFIGVSFTSATLTLNLWSTSAQYASFSAMGLSGALSVLRASMGPAIVMFMAMYQLTSALGESAWLLIPIIIALTAAMAIYAATTWSAAIALSILTWGAAALIGVGAAMYAQSQVPTYQMGTSYVQKTGPAIVHRGEQIIPAGERRVVGINEGGRPAISRNQIIIHIGTVKTKADEEELTPLILRVIKKGMDDKV